jgi:hypothetical protein
MEIKRIRSLRVALVPEDVECDALTRENAGLFYTAEKYNVPVLKGVVSEFEDALKEELGFNGKRPKKTRERRLTRGSIEFVVKQTPTSNPSYQAIGERIGQYLTDIQGLNEEGMRREGVRTIDEEAYLLLDDITAKVEELQEEFANEGSRTNITYSKMRKDADLGKLLDIEPGTFGVVTGENAKTYRIAKEQLKLLGKSVINPFKASLKTETGYDTNNVPEETQYDMFGIGDFIFMVVTAPREEVKYGKAAKGIIAMLDEPEGFARQRDGNLYVPVSTLVETYDKLVADNTRTIVQQDIKVMPEPKYDHILVR